jgi:octaprenyl-diphosphate synthase
VVKKVGNFVQAHDPIKEELYEVEIVLKSIGKNITSTSSQDIFDHFFRIPGKHLRPTLILLCSNAINPCLNIRQKEQLIHLSVAVELIHSASLIHDDIIDGDLFRRGQKTLNNVYERKIAVLAGDTLYAKAFSILSNYLDKGQNNCHYQL